MTKFITDELLHKVQEWFYVRNLQNGDPKAQYLKLVEEVGEIRNAPDTGELIDAYGDTFVTAIGLCLQTGTSIENIISELAYTTEATTSELSKRDILTDISRLAADLARGKNLEKSIFEVLNTVTLFALSEDITIQHCLEVAYDVIKDRKGMLINDVYVKYEDLSDENKAKLDA